MDRRLTVVAIVSAASIVVAATSLGGVRLTAQEAARRIKQTYFGYRVGGTAKEGRPSALYLLEGGGRHSVMLAADDQTIVVGTKSERGWSQPMLEKIANVTELPVKVLINTNVHQAGSNAEFHDAVEIIAHEHTKARLATLDAFRGANARFLPNKTFADRLVLPVKTDGEKEGTNRIELYYFGPAYTDGDVVAVFPQFGVAFLGELFPDKAVPVVDLANGGSAVAFAETLAKAAAAIREMPGISVLAPGNAVVPDHMILSWLTVKDLDDYVEFNRAFVSAVKEAIANGKTPSEAAAGLKLPDKFRAYGMEHLPDMVKAIYAELNKK
jgi:hypothetical protein